MNRAIPGFTRDKQRRASDPDVSAFVSANAGSGKTHVLAQRVMRLLLAGVAPNKILCLTFTKAASANMSQRVFRTLAQWTSLDDHALALAMESAGVDRPGAAQRLLARRLFARTIESPGGLRIQTIHGFCEAVLHRFPFEANVPSRFEALDDERRTELLNEAREATLREAIGDEHGALGRSLRALAGETTAHTFNELITESLASREIADEAIEGDASGEEYARRLGALFRLTPQRTVDAIERSMIEDGFAPSRWPAVAKLFEQGSAADLKSAERLRNAMRAPTSSERLADYLAVFLTAANEPRARVITAALRMLDPQLAGELDAERDRLGALIEERKAAALVARSHALVVLVGSILRGYRALKSRRGWLDFDDLIERTANLLQRADAAWIMYKLDAGIDHILVDEAQDTSERQWRILRALADEFMAGAGARSQERTVFAVGDEKQSIYSFQGAAPHLFDEMRRGFSSRHESAEKPFEHVLLTMSFRSSRAVLAAVDCIFSIPDNARGLSAQIGPIDSHLAWKSDLPGLVELWEPVRPSPQPDPVDWRLPLDTRTSADPAVVLAERIARQVAEWLAPGSAELVHDEEPRPIRHGDILILVRSRGALFESIIRALKERGLPVAGADRLILTEHIAVMDLIAAGRAALLPDDDLTLACVLKSPLIGLLDEDLIALAPDRRGSLSEALEQSLEPRHRLAVNMIGRWRTRAANGSAFSFYARLLGEDGGRRRLLSRLGPEAADAIDEFLTKALDHDRQNPPSLTTFLHAMENANICVKRDMDAAGDFIRVMTAHAAKGLEAKIVILPDTCGAASGGHDPRIFHLASPHGRLPAWSPRRECDPQLVGQARAQARAEQEEEHHRLLYVALTRAEERLYIAACEGGRGRGNGCWYDMIRAALSPHMSVHSAPWDAEDRIYRMSYEWPPRSALVRAEESRPVDQALPNWLTQAGPKERAAAPPLRPSSALAAADQRQGAPGLDYAEMKAAAALGALTHSLLQHLPGVNAGAREEAAEAFLRLRAGELSEDQRREVAERVVALIEDRRLAPLFGERSRAEVAICGRAVLPGGGFADVVGTIDRLAETDEGVLIVDFKTGRSDANKPAPQAYVAQLALYRALVASIWKDRPVRAFLVWTNGARIYEPTGEELHEALRRIAGLAHAG